VDNTVFETVENRQSPRGRRRERVLGVFVSVSVAESGYC
jgi:hypothetical protein